MNKLFTPERKGCKLNSKPSLTCHYLRFFAQGGVYVNARNVLILQKRNSRVKIVHIRATFLAQLVSAQLQLSFSSVSAQFQLSFSSVIAQF